VDSPRDQVISRTIFLQAQTKVQSASTLIM